MAEHGRIRILVADDDPAFLATVRAILGFDERLELVAEAHDGGQAVKLADELLPDVVAMDVAMPGIDGIEATKLIRARRPDCRVVLVSGSIFEGRTGKDLPETKAFPQAIADHAQPPERPPHPGCAAP